MTPEELAAIHAACFTMPAPWSAKAFADLLASPLTFLLTESDGFLLGRVVADEAELLTLAVAPEARGKGQGGRLVTRFLEQSAERGAVSAFLEVAATNTPAISLYHKAGFAESGLRRGYYHPPNGPRIDALVMARGLV